MDNIGEFVKLIKETLQSLRHRDRPLVALFLFVVLVLVFVLCQTTAMRWVLLGFLLTVGAALVILIYRQTSTSNLSEPQRKVLAKTLLLEQGLRGFPTRYISKPIGETHTRFVEVFEELLL
jgi:hypothetical protein